MRVRFIAKMPARGYSGGRLLALTYAEALAVVGVDVEFLTDVVPEMYEEFAPFSKVKIRVCDLAQIASDPHSRPDATMIIPCQGAVPFHGEAARASIENGSKIVLLNFESPNWFNSLSSATRDPVLWEGWDIISQYSDLILSLSAEGNRFAREYYTRVPAGCRFDFCHASINSHAADAAVGRSPREDRVVVLTRIDPHKGFSNLGALAMPELKGFTVQVHVGTGRAPEKLEREWTKRFAEVGAQFKLCGPVKGVAKFVLLKSSKLLYFPTQFEGFGIPPLEAAYCQLPCACSNLPVLREFGGDSLCYGDPSNPASMQDAIRNALRDPHRGDADQARIRDIARLESCGERLRSKINALL